MAGASTVIRGPELESKYYVNESIKVSNFVKSGLHLLSPPLLKAHQAEFNGPYSTSRITDLSLFFLKDSAQRTAQENKIL